MTHSLHSADDEARREARAGVLYGVAAYGLWGVAPIYFKAVASVPAFEVLGHRIVWAELFLLCVIAASGGRDRLVAILRDARAMRYLCATTVFIATNWLIFIWAVAHNRVLEVSMGYFINPLITVLLGVVFLRERLTPAALASVALAGAGVAWQTLGEGRLPLLAIVLPCSFGMYGLLRKKAGVDPIAGLAVEAMLLFPLALGGLGWLAWTGMGKFGSEGIAFDLLLAFAGVITSIPLIFFAKATKRLRLATVGFLHYITPTGQFLLGAFLYGEPLSPAKIAAFALIWVGLGIYSWDTLRRLRRRTEPSRTAPAEQPPLAPALETAACASAAE